jgi:hypothetical protein
MMDLIEKRNYTIGKAVYLIEVLLEEMLHANPDLRLSSITRQAEDFCKEHTAEWHSYLDNGYRT